ncbi:hypothetical protein [Mucilaginibacter sp. HD30]
MSITPKAPTPSPIIPSSSKTNLSLIAAAFKKIRNGQRLPQQYQVKQWNRNSADAPVIRIDGKHAFWNNTIYLQMP